MPAKSKTPSRSKQSRSKPNSKPPRGKTGEDFVGIHIINDHIPEDEILIDDPEVLQTLYEPTRLRVFKLLSRAPLSVNELAEALEDTPNRLYHHVRLLQKHGLIRVAAGRVVGNRVERQYGPAAQKFRFGEAVKASPLRMSVGGIQDDLGEMVRQISESFAAQQQGEFGAADDYASLLFQSVKRMPLTTAKEFSERIQALADEYNQGPGGEDDRLYSLYAIFLPVADSVIGEFA